MLGAPGYSLPYKQIKAQFVVQAQVANRGSVSRKAVLMDQGRASMGRIMWRWK